MVSCLRRFVSGEHAISRHALRTGCGSALRRACRKVASSYEKFDPRSTLKTEIRTGAGGYLMNAARAVVLGGVETENK